MFQIFTKKLLFIALLLNCINTIDAQKLFCKDLNNGSPPYSFFGELIEEGICDKKHYLYYENNNPEQVYYANINFELKDSLELKKLASIVHKFTHLRYIHINISDKLKSPDVYTLLKGLFSSKDLKGLLVSLNTERLKVILPSISRQKNLTRLYFYTWGKNMNIDYLMLKKICQVKSLRMLGINNYQSNQIPENFSNLTYLYSFSIEPQQELHFPKETKNLDSLNFIYIGNNYKKTLGERIVFKTFPKPLCYLKNILDIGFTWACVNKLPKEILLLGDKIPFDDIPFNGNKFSKSSVKFLKYDTSNIFKNLIIVNVNRSINFKILKPYKAIKKLKLEDVSIAGKKLEKMMTSLSKLNHLTSLILTFTYPISRISAFTKLTNLKELVIKNHSFSEDDMKLLREVLPNTNIRFFK